MRVLVAYASSRERRNQPQRHLHTQPGAAAAAWRAWYGESPFHNFFTVFQTPKPRSAAERHAPRRSDRDGSEARSFSAPGPRDSPPTLRLRSSGTRIAAPPPPGRGNEKRLEDGVAKRNFSADGPTGSAATRFRIPLPRPPPRDRHPIGTQRSRRALPEAAGAMAMTAAATGT